MWHIDINCDLAEGGTEDEQIMPLISSCNIACGGHAGTSDLIAKTVRLAVQNGVKIGAHPSYPDPVNFGRKPMDISLSELKKSLIWQMERVLAETRNQQAKLHHVKPHGALYNELMTDGEKSEILIELVREIDADLILYVPPKSAIKTRAKGKLKTMTEGFADRKYQSDFRLVSRQKKGAVIQKKEAVFEQVFSMISERKIRLENGSVLTSFFDTICVHGDTPNCVEILRYLHKKLHEKNIEISGS